MITFRNFLKLWCVQRCLYHGYMCHGSRRSVMSPNSKRCFYNQSSVLVTVERCNYQRWRAEPRNEHRHRSNVGSTWEYFLVSVYIISRTLTER